MRTSLPVGDDGARFGYLAIIPGGSLDTERGKRLGYLLPNGELVRLRRAAALPGSARITVQEHTGRPELRVVASGKRRPAAFLDAKRSYPHRRLGGNDNVGGNGAILKPALDDLSAKENQWMIGEVFNLQRVDVPCLADLRLAVSESLSKAQERSRNRRIAPVDRRKLETAVSDEFAEFERGSKGVRGQSEYHEGCREGAP